MLLSDRLEEIYNNSGKFDLETCNAIIHAIADKIKEELDGLIKTVKQKGSINSNILYSSVNSIRNVFNNFIKKHPDIPQILIDKENANIASYKKLVDEVVYNSLNRNN